jgi:ribosomal-protein-alanine N-acetyltransferase
METMLDHARDRHSRLVLLEVRRSNRAAIALYRAHGFSAIGIRRAYYRDTDEDAVEMMLALDPRSGRVLPGRDELSLGDL